MVVSDVNQEFLFVGRNSVYSVIVAENSHIVHSEHRRRRRRKSRKLKRRLIVISLLIAFFAVWAFAVVKATRYFAEKDELGKKIEYIDMGTPSGFKKDDSNG